MNLLAKTDHDYGFVPGMQAEYELDLKVKAFARAMTFRAPRSPDLGVLEESEFQLLFCADNTMRGCHNYPLIEDSVYLQHAFTLKRFNYYRQRDGVPIPLPAQSNRRVTGYSAPPLKVKGELHAVKSYQFEKLDIEMDNLVSFRRQRVKLLIPQSPVYKIPHRYYNGKIIPLMTDQYAVGAEQIRPLEVWMYVAEPTYWEPLLDGGYLFTHVEHYKDKRPWLGAYYSMKRESYF